MEVEGDVGRVRSESGRPHRIDNHRILRPPGETMAGGGTILEYGASAVFPCGVIPATDRQGRVPAFGSLPSYALRVFLERDRRRRRWILVDVDQCGSVAVRIERWL